MPPLPIPLPKSTFPGQRAQDGRGILTNCYAEPDGDGGEARWRRVAGLKPFGTAASGEFRGRIAVPGALYAVFGTKVYRYTASGGVGEALIGSVPGERPVIMARNNATIPDVVIVAPGDGVFVISGNSVVEYPDTDVGQPNSVCVFKTFFIFSYGDGTVRASSPNSTDINTLDYATAEYKPDTLLRVVPAGGVLLAFGSSSIEVWGGAVNDPPGFPFSYMQGIDRGLIGLYALSGYEDGFGGGIIFVGDDCGVYQFASGSPSKISPPDLDVLIGKVQDKSSIEVTTFADSGHLFAVVQCADWSWTFDLNTQKWHLRRSYLQKRWRATQAVQAFGKWIVGDTLTSALAVIDAGTRKEFGDALRYTVETGPAKNFPSRLRINRVFVYMTVGAGVATGEDPIETDPILEIECSLDGGLTWSIPRLVPIGRQAIGRQSVAANNFGHATGQGVRWRFSVSDPVDVLLMAAAMEARELRA
jgi:hypothetical protein